MIDYKSAPTKTNLLKFKEELELAQEGYELLDKKKEVLLRELLRLLYEVKGVQEKVSMELKKIYDKFKSAESKLGKERLKYILSFKTEGLEIDVIEKSIMGIHVPVISPLELKPKYFSFLHTPSQLDETIKMLSEIFPLFLHYIEVVFSLFRVANEVKKTERKLRALENIFIPQYKQEVTRIESILEETERDEFFRHKRVKEKIGRR
jgi:V/A-type H+-transporting ATPase subunit D